MARLNTKLIKGSSTINQSHVNKDRNDHKHSLTQVRLTIKCVELKGRIGQRNLNYSMMDQGKTRVKLDEYKDKIDLKE